jgi:malate dehydrogenase (oxaloacetate-decarboxylating)(NADP+)
MFIVAAKAVAEQVSSESLEKGLIYPPQSDIYEASIHVAAAVAAYIFDHGFARVTRPGDLVAHLKSVAYSPTYQLL